MAVGATPDDERAFGVFKHLRLDDHGPLFRPAFQPLAASFTLTAGERPGLVEAPVSGQTFGDVEFV